ncbi:MAG: hypothetical protein E7657_06595 [Ruminococcaceae bacterium]|nr:hypothetical protein [Oscillospiraceae bacterium]
MYIGKHRGATDSEAPRETKPIHIPENYAGNAFVIEEQDEAKDTCQACKSETTPLPLQEAKSKKQSYFKADGLFSTDTLLVLLAILLFGNEENGELPIILLLLLLF